MNNKSFENIFFSAEDATPNLNDLQNYLMGDTKEDSDKYINFTSKLLKIALSDPGVPNPKEVSNLNWLFKSLKRNCLSNDLNLFAGR